MTAGPLLAKAGRCDCRQCRGGPNIAKELYCFWLLAAGAIVGVGLAGATGPEEAGSCTVRRAAAGQRGCLSIPVTFITHKLHGAQGGKAGGEDRAQGDRAPPCGAWRVGMGSRPPWAGGGTASGEGRGRNGIGRGPTTPPLCMGRL
jgi:hypothetical protein